jgi:hypothetical protein
MLGFSTVACALLALLAAPASATVYTAIPNLQGEVLGITYYSSPGVLYTGPGQPVIYNNNAALTPTGLGFVVGFFGDGTPFDSSSTTNHGLFLSFTPSQLTISCEDIQYTPPVFPGFEITLAAGQQGVPRFSSVNYLGAEYSNGYFPCQDPHAACLTTTPPPNPPVVTLDPTGQSILINIDAKTCGKYIQYNYGYTAEILGDPQFTGFVGQAFQVHGTSGSIYNIMSTPSFQYNALFRYLDAGHARRGTQAFSHPGNYFGNVGVMIKDAAGVTNQVLIQSGAVDAGLTLQINNQTMAVSDHVMNVGDYKVSLPNEFEVLLESDEFNVRVQNSDFFLNQEVSIGSGLMRKISAYKQALRAGDANTAELKAALPHGILGQTWNTVTYDNRWKHIEGHLFEYQLSDGVFGNDFKYNKF